MWCEVRVQFHSFACSYPLVPAPFDEKIILSWLNGLGTIFENQLAVDVWVYFWTLNSILLIYMSVLVLVPHCLDYHCFVVNFQFWRCESSYFVLLKDCFGYSVSLAIPYEFYNQVVNASKKSDRILIGIVESVQQFREYCHLNVKLSDSWTLIFFHLFRSLISFKNVF